MERLSLTLHLDLTERGTEGPGWYIRAESDTQAFFTPIYIEPDVAQGLANAFQAALQASASELPAVGPLQLVASGTNLVNQALKQQLEYAEQQAARIKTLRRRLALLPTSDRVEQ